MLIKYDGTELDAAIINAIFAAYIESPFDDQMVSESLDSGEHLTAYQDMRRDFHQERKLSIGNARMPHLFPGEKIATVEAARPNSNFAEFESAMLRNIAAGTGTSAQMISQNWADVNYSSYRAAMLEVWKTFSRRRINFATGFGQPVFCAWLEEAMDVDDLPLPAGAPAFIEYRAAYSRARWMGPGKGFVDPTKEKEGAIMGIDAGLSNLEEESWELSGRDWRENVSQRAIERKFFKDLDMPIPESLSGGKASDAKTPPEAE